MTFPASSSTNKAGLVFTHDGSNSYYAVVIDRGAGKLALHKWYMGLAAQYPARTFPCQRLAVALVDHGA